MTKKSIIKLINYEIKWHEKNKGNKNINFKKGFILGMNHILKLIKKDYIYVKKERIL